MAEDSGGWIGYVGDEHGRPARHGNDHLTDEQREELTRRADARAEARGRRQAVVRVNVYENGDAEPQVHLPDGSAISPPPTVTPSTRASNSPPTRCASGADSGSPVAGMMVGVPRDWHLDRYPGK